MKTEPLFMERFDTPTGRMLVVTDPDGRACAVDWEDHEERMHRLLCRGFRELSFAIHEAVTPSAVRRALEAYFSGDFSAIAALEPLTRGTPFQRDVWRALRGIPRGRTLSYAGLAQKIGRSTAVRAVGSANGANPIAIIVPCHRVIGANAALSGYAGGVERKRWLLSHEGVET